MDIRPVINRAGSYFIIFVFFITSIFLPYTYLPYPFISLLLIGFLWLLFGDHFRAKIQTTADQKWLTDWYDPTQIVENVSKKISSSLNRIDIIKESFDIINNYIPVKNHLILVAEKNSKGNVYNYLVIKNKERLDKSIDPSNKFISYIKKIKKSILFKEIPNDINFILEEFHKIKKSIILPLFSKDSLDGILILGERLSEASFGSKDINFFQTITEIISVYLERLIPYEKIKKEYEQTLEIAQNMSYQASFSKLSLGIAHEIRNPLSVIKSDAEVNRMDINSFKIPWDGTILPEDFIKIFSNNKHIEEAENLYYKLKASGYICQDNKLTEKYQPFSRDPIPELLDFDPVSIKLINDALFEKYKKKEISTYFQTTSDLVDRIVNITETMLKYGLADTRLRSETFTKIDGITIQISEAIFYELYSKHYIDIHGGLLPRFNPTSSEFKLDISDKYKQYEDKILALIKEQPIVKKERIDIIKVIDSIINLLKNSLVNNNIYVEKKFDQSYFVLGNELRLYQAFFNVIKNSIQALSKVSKDRKVIICSIDPKEYMNANSTNIEGIEISFYDNGPGIPEDNLNKISDPFFSTKETAGGKNLGLGVSVLFRVINAHGGIVKVETKENEWTIFRVYLPLCLESN